MTAYRCENCGSSWEGNKSDDSFVEVYFCVDCAPTFRVREGKAEASEAGTERARADYYKTLCELQKGVIEDYRNFLFISNPQKINAVSPREWDLGRQVYFLDMNCKMLENLVDEYRKELEEAAKRIN